MTAEKEEKRVKVALVYTGTVMVSSKDGPPGARKIGAAYLLISGATITPDERYFSKPVHGGRPGAVFEFDSKTDEAMSIYPASYRYVGHVLDDDAPWVLASLKPGESSSTPPHDTLDLKNMVAMWQAKHDAVRMEKDLKAAEAKGKNVKAIERQIRPLRHAYWNLAPNQRSVYVAQVVLALTSRKDTD